VSFHRPSFHRASRRPRLALLLALLALAAAPAALAGDPPAAPAPNPGPAPGEVLAIGEKAPDLTATDLDGKPFALATARTVTPADALASVNTAAKALGATADLMPTDGLDKVPGLKDDAGLVKAKVVAFAVAAGRAHGLVADDTTVAEWTLVGDVAAWVARAAEAPIVFVCWSPKCPTSKLFEERLVTAAARRGARMYLVASNATDAADDLKSYVETKELPFRVLVDAEQKLTDVFGGKRTPHVFVLDAKNVLRYGGTVDNDAPMTEAEEKRISYLDLALAALGEGRLPEILLTTPVG
jgi:peroxiredoxin